jgi:hypothetical protein
VIKFGTQLNATEMRVWHCLKLRACDWIFLHAHNVMICHKICLWLTEAGSTCVTKSGKLVPFSCLHLNAWVAEWIFREIWYRRVLDICRNTPVSFQFDDSN